MTTTPKAGAFEDLVIPEECNFTTQSARYLWDLINEDDMILKKTA